MGVRDLQAEEHRRFPSKPRERGRGQERFLHCFPTEPHHADTSTSDFCLQIHETTPACCLGPLVCGAGARGVGRVLGNQWGPGLPGRVLRVWGDPKSRPRKAVSPAQIGVC